MSDSQKVSRHEMRNGSLTDGGKLEALGVSDGRNRSLQEKCNGSVIALKVEPDATEQGRDIVESRVQL